MLIDNANLSTNLDHIYIIELTLAKIDSDLTSVVSGYVPPLLLPLDIVQAIQQLESIAHDLNREEFAYLLDEIFLRIICGTIKHPHRNRPLLNIALRLGFQTEFKYASKSRFICELTECYALERQQEVHDFSALKTEGRLNSDIIKEFISHVTQGKIHTYNLFFLPSADKHFVHLRWFPFIPELNRDINIDIFSPLNATVEIDTVVFHIGGYNNMEKYLARQSSFPEKYGSVYAKVAQTCGVRPFVLVFIPCYYEDVSYKVFQASAGLFRDALIPLVQKHFNLSLPGMKLIFSGYSLGGLYAITTGVQLEKNASYVITSGAGMLMSLRVIYKTNNSTQHIKHMFISCGIHDNLLKENQHFAKFINKNNVPYKFIEHDAGHSWHQIRSVLEEGLIWTLRNLETAP